jgi:serine phosphatase RsbU (regulator of sigma subunit)/PAS domain-containing protein
VDDAVNPAMVDARDIDRLRGELAIDAAGIGTFDWDLVSGRLDWDDRLIEIFGFDPGTFDSTIEAFNSRVHADDLDRVTLALQTAIDTCGDFSAMYRVRLPTGDTRWVSARGHTLCDPGGQAIRLLGAAYDITDQRDTELAVTRVLEAMPAGFYSLDREWRFTHVNAAAEKLLLRSREELLGQVIWAEFPAAAGSIFEDSYRQAVTTGEPVNFPAYYPPPLDGWYELRAWPSPDGLSVYFSDITAQVEADRRAARTATRLGLIAEISQALTAGDVHDLLHRLPTLLAPTLADSCIVTEIGPDGRARDISSWHVDEHLRPALEDYARIRLVDLPPHAPFARAVRTGVMELLSAQTIAAVPVNAPARVHLDRLGPPRGSVHPLRAHGQVLGALTLLSSPDRPVDDEDEATAQDIADRLGAALQASRVSQARTQLVEDLQRSLLTDPPEPDHARIVVRYLPASQAAQVGGDWYDAFLQPGGTTTIVIGDVVGHDTAAAAAMGQLRSLLRGIAGYSDAGPAEVLRGVDATMQLLQISTLATAAIARFEQSAEEVDRGVTRMRWANAGHPPPLVLHPDGTHALLGAAKGDLLLGVDPATTRSERVVLLDEGSTVLLYTDGLVERPDSDLDAGLDRLTSAATELADASLDELCDGLLTRLVDGRPTDDVALVAIRLHRRDRSGQGSPSA